MLFNQNQDKQKLKNTKNQPTNQQQNKEKTKQKIPKKQQQQQKPKPIHSAGIIKFLQGKWADLFVQFHKHLLLLAHHSASVALSSLSCPAAEVCGR